MDGIAMCAVAMEEAQRRLERATTTLSNAETDGFAQHLGKGSHQALRPTGQPLDLAVSGAGTLRVAKRGTGGVLERETHVQAASFHRDAAGYVVDTHGRTLMGTSGPIRVFGEVVIRPDGAVACDGTVIAHIALRRGDEVHSGFTVGSNVNSIGEMIEILDAQRSFETAQKTLTAVDAARQKATTDVGHLQ